MDLQLVFRVCRVSGIIVCTILTDYVQATGYIDDVTKAISEWSPLIAVDKEGCM